MISPSPSAPLVTEDRWTYARYLRETAEGEYFTVIGGEKIMSPSPTSFHQFIIINLSLILSRWLKQTRAGKLQVAPLDVVLAEDEIAQPDLMVILSEHRSRITERNIQGAPDLVVEILSPGSVRLDREKKRELYARHAVPEYWIVSPGERTVEVLQLRGAQYDLAALYEEGETLQSPLLTGFTCNTREIFED
jgi:Uma2 family endonuclease